MSDFLKSRVPSGRFGRILVRYLRFAAVCLMITALARPREDLKERNYIKSTIDIMLVMDVSRSMKAIDFDPYNRMQAAVKAAKEFIANRSSDRLGVVLFASMPVLHCPLTLDNDAVASIMENISAGMIGAGGTAIGMGVALGLKYLDRSDSPSKVMILLTDGANNAGFIKPLEAAGMAAALDIKIYTIGTGKPGPARIPVDDPVMGRRYVTIADELDEKTLQEIADITGGKYFRATSFEKLNEIYAQIDMMEKSEVKVKEYFEYEEKFYPFLFAALLLILLEMLLRFMRPGMFT
ncbi:MAG: VWA domain-containing protein [Elusimicrobiota bacterium]